MIVTIHQPEFFPYSGFFEKANLVDKVIFLDTVKFRKNNYQNRNKILRNGKEDWITLPVEKLANSKRICDVLVGKNEKDILLLIRKIEEICKNKNTIDEFKKIISTSENVSDINIASILWSQKELYGKDLSTIRSSEIDHDQNLSKTDLLIDLLKKVNAKKYLSGPSGKNYLEFDKFEKENIEVVFFEPDWSSSYDYGLSSLYRIINK